MTPEIILRYLHFISILCIAGTLAVENVWVRSSLRRSELARLSRVDAIYGIASLLLLAAGLTLWLGSYGKPAIYYNKNWIFHLKLGLFACLGLLSIYPTVFFLKHRKGNADEPVTIPPRLILLLRLELLLLLIIPFLAGLMARGFGYHYKP